MLKLKYYSNILSTNVQKFRKELSLWPWDEIIVDYKTDKTDSGIPL